jgi:SAM-dependent methyltransferase
MKTKKAMDLFGEALKAYYRGESVHFFLKDQSGRLFKTDLSRYFRKTNQLSKLERRLISLSYGDILDVGCGTGYYIPLLAERGQVLGIDISPNIIELARKSGCKFCKVADIFSYSTTKKYDTITFLGNNLGIGGTVNKTKKLLEKLSHLLKDDGQILATIRRVPGRKFVVARIKPVWGKRTGPEFGWIHFNIDFLSDLCEQAGFRLKVLRGNQHYYLLRIARKVR